MAKKKAAPRKRDYRAEYDSYHSKPEQKKNRAARNSARAEAIKEGKVSKGTKNNRSTQEIDHKKPLSKGGSNAKGNTRVVSRTVNRKKADKTLGTGKKKK